ncbi:MAG: hypothetical protein HYZ91_02955, partial [Candidatus Omnitrophica bacterium]|nr:hypothetical protein [Candidatus Omnitrophota bacterium]
EPQSATTEQHQESKEPLRFTPLAEQFLEAAKARLEEQKRQEAERERAGQEAEAERARARERQDAQRLAIELSRQKLSQQAVKQREAQRQLQLARERQLKALYQKALAFYQRGAYQEAVQVLQQMVLIDPDHPLAKAADRLISRVELKHFEEQLRAKTELPPGSRGAIVPELEQLLTQKRMELETVFKYAKAAILDRKYDTAIRLLTAILVQNPSDHEAQQLIEQAQGAKLREDEHRIQRQQKLDDQAMLNDVLKAELLPEVRRGPSAASQLLAGGADPAMVARLREPISFEFNEVALSDVLEFIADAAGVSIIPSPKLDLKTRRVSLRVKELPLEQAIKYLAKTLSLGYRVEQDAILIATPEEFSNEPLETRVFFLHNGLGPFALKTAAVEANPALAMQSVTELIERTIPQPPESKFVVDERTGALVMTNTAENLLLLERLLSQLDITPIQVLIEARFIELTITDLEQFALESVLNGNSSLTKQTATDNTRGPGHQLNSGSGFKFPTLSRETEGLNLTLQGILTGTQFESALHLLEESRKTKTLSAPRVTTLNNQTAQISVVEEFNYPTRYEVSRIQFDINGDGDFDDAGETEFANVPQDLQKRNVGILLNVTPSVGKDLKTITLVLAPEVSAFSQFRNLGGGVTVPEFTSSQLTTSVVIEDGQTVVLGGLMKDTASNQVTKVPILGDLPLVGGLFRQKENSNTRKNLLIFITARLLAPRGQAT